MTVGVCCQSFPRFVPNRCKTQETEGADCTISILKNWHHLSAVFPLICCWYARKWILKTLMLQCTNRATDKRLQKLKACYCRGKRGLKFERHFVYLCCCLPVDGSIHQSVIRLDKFRENFITCHQNSSYSVSVSMNTTVQCSLFRGEAGLAAQVLIWQTCCPVIHM